MQAQNCVGHLQNPDVSWNTASDRGSVFNVESAQLVKFHNVTFSYNSGEGHSKEAPYQRGKTVLGWGICITTKRSRTISCDLEVLKVVETSSQSWALQSSCRNTCLLGMSLGLEQSIHCQHYIM